METGRQGDCLQNRVFPCQKGRVESSALTDFLCAPKAIFPHLITSDLQDFVSQLVIKKRFQESGY